jgi:hypothetical protein
VKVYSYIKDIKAPLFSDDVRKMFRDVVELLWLMLGAIATLAMCMIICLILMYIRG